jgi:recombination protein U
MRNQANKGLYLEQWVEQANSAYMKKGLAIITKIPTPWKVLRTYNPYTKQYKITNAFPEKKSTVDFGGTSSKQWLLWIDQLSKFVTEEEMKSLSFKWLDENCEVVKSQNGIILDYLPLVLKRKEDK